MPRPKTVTLTLAVDADGICASQTPGGSGSLTLDGALIGTDPQNSTIYTSSTAQQIGITSAGNDSGRTFTVTGKGYDSNSVWTDPISEAITGPNATTVESSYYYTEISDISIDGAAAGAITIGPVDEAISPLIPLNYITASDTGIASGVTGTINYDIDVTLSEIQDSSATIDFLPDASVLTGQTAAAEMSITSGARAVRVQVNSGSDAGEVRVNIVQSR